MAYQGSYQTATVSSAGTRPASVTLAASLMVISGVLSTVSGGFLMWELLTLEPGTNGNLVVQRTLGLVVGGVFLLFGLGVIGLALAVLRGRGWARTLTFVVYGFFLVVDVLGTVAFAAVMAQFNSSNTVKDTMGPSGGAVVLAVLAAGAVVMALTIILLALSAARRWFRERSLARAQGV